ncbi:uncharacterized protein MONBRDRAFT_38292 [Monosiga brevicollis MX1]|uniref:Uncharacterized protein n=1 Tax=Monosiga brevicollis TaxID=81824 RepID=A9V6J0_MONBE|nr:uncharacterized protein MONBRDRAFT_38292 [Monosiga brevicollis MX1]EDQ86893.1 predicted protein [Monosiga brevicollis MX1]|eukprot:XP_001748438.1 hypothetical protein [Monosiga brevicollis MX1]
MTQRMTARQRWRTKLNETGTDFGDGYVSSALEVPVQSTPSVKAEVASNDQFKKPMPIAASGTAAGMSAAPLRIASNLRPSDEGSLLGRNFNKRNVQTKELPATRPTFEPMPLDETVDIYGEGKREFILALDRRTNAATLHPLDHYYEARRARQVVAIDADEADALMESGANLQIKHSALQLALNRQREDMEQPEMQRLTTSSNELQLSEAALGAQDETDASGFRHGSKATKRYNHTGQEVGANPDEIDDIDNLDEGFEVRDEDEVLPATGPKFDILQKNDDEVLDSETEDESAEEEVDDADLVRLKRRLETGNSDTESEDDEFGTESHRATRSNRAPRTLSSPHNRGRSLTDPLVSTDEEEKANKEQAEEKKAEEEANAKPASTTSSQPVTGQKREAPAAVSTHANQASAPVSTSAGASALANSATATASTKSSDASGEPQRKRAKGPQVSQKAMTFIRNMIIKYLRRKTMNDKELWASVGKNKYGGQRISELPGGEECFRETLKTVAKHKWHNKERLWDLIAGE